MKKTKLKLSRQTIRTLSDAPLAKVAGGYQEKPTYSCNITFCCRSVFNSCYDTDCCLMVP